MKSNKIAFPFDQNESQTFVQNLDDSFEIAKTLVAFANTNGGKLIVGVKSNYKIIGIFPEDEIRKLENINKECFPQLSFQTEIQERGFRFILIISIEKSSILPHYINDQLNKKVTYIRVGQQNILASKLQIQAWKYKDRNSVCPGLLSPEESKIVEIIKLNPQISQTQIYKKSDFPIDTIDYCLVRLINWKKIQMKITETGSIFDIFL